MGNDLTQIKHLIIYIYQRKNRAYGSVFLIFTLSLLFGPAHKRHQ